MSEEANSPPAGTKLPAVGEDDLPEDKPPQETPPPPLPPQKREGPDEGSDPFLPAVGQRRRTVGYVLAASDILLFVGLGAFSIKELSGLEPTRGAPGIDYKWFDLARLGAHAVITVALIYFLYRLLQMAERLCLPHWFTRGGEWALLLGQDISPLDRGAKMLTETVRAVVSALLPEIKKAAKRHNPTPEEDEQ